MEIGKLDVGAWLTLRPMDERIGEVRLKIKPVSPDFTFPADGDAQAQITALGSLIVDWNLESDGVAITCTDEAKGRYLWHLVRVEVHGEGEATESLAGPVARFAIDINNFLGN